MRRRDLLRIAGVATAVGLAGCPSGREADEGKPRVPNEPDYRDWFDGVSNYDRTIDLRGQDEAEVSVGARGNNGHYAFSPAAVAITPGTTVRWIWTGQGGEHNVVSEADAFDSGSTVSGEDEEFAHGFEDPAIYRYVCEPHRGLGMRGAVFVALGAPES